MARRRKKSGTAGLGKFVSRKKGLYRSGPKKGQLKKGCRWVKGRGGSRILCVDPAKRTPEKTRCCRFGVNKRTGECLKRPRRKKKKKKAIE